MKKLLLLLAILSVLVLAACGGEEKESSEPAVNTETSSDTKTNETTTTEDEEKDDTNANENIEEDDDLRVENTYTDKELGISGEAGPMLYNITGVQLKKITVKSDEMANLFEVNVGDVVQAITIKMDGENTSDEDMSFYLGQATIITNTKEQLEPNMWLSEHIEGEYLGKVAHEGFNVYLLKKSTVDELESIEIRISSPMDSNWDHYGEDIKHIIEVNK